MTARTLPVPILLFLVGGALLTGILAYKFYCDPYAGMAEATHRPEKLPLVMIDRYVAVSIIQAGLICFGSLEMVGVFCVAGAVMGLGDGFIYANAGFPHWKHTLSGILALLGLVMVLCYIAMQRTAGAIEQLDL